MGGWVGGGEGDFSLLKPMEILVVVTVATTQTFQCWSLTYPTVVVGGGGRKGGIRRLGLSSNIDHRPMRGELVTSHVSLQVLHKGLVVAAVLGPYVSEMRIRWTPHPLSIEFLNFE